MNTQNKLKALKKFINKSSKLFFSNVNCFRIKKKTNFSQVKALPLFFIPMFSHLNHAGNVFYVFWKER